MFPGKWTSDGVWGSTSTNWKQTAHWLLAILCELVYVQAGFPLRFSVDGKWICTVCNGGSELVSCLIFGAQQGFQLLHWPTQLLFSSLTGSRMSQLGLELCHLKHTQSINTYNNNTIIKLIKKHFSVYWSTFYVTGRNVHSHASGSEQPVVTMTTEVVQSIK